MKHFFTVKSARFQDEQLIDFGDLQAELAAAESEDIICPLLERGVIRFSGDDAKNFLQVLLTNDVNALGADSYQQTALCSPKGRMLANMLLFTQENSYYAVFASDLTESLYKRFKTYVLRSKVSLADASADFVFLGLSGKNVAAVLQGSGYDVPIQPMQLTHAPEATLLCLEPTRFILAVAKSHAETTWEALSKTLRPVGSPVWQWLDIKAGQPLITLATTETFVPQMLDFDKIGGVNFKKGCYPGQEVVARARYLGEIKRHLYEIQTDHPVKAGSRIYTRTESDQACGSIVNASPAPGNTYVALAVIRAEYAEPQVLRFESDETKVLAVTRCRVPVDKQDA